MPYYLRKILDLKQWQPCECLGDGQIPADPLKDIYTKKCGLSIYKINESEDNLEDVLVELALMNSKEANRLDYIKLNDSDFGDLRPVQTPPTIVYISNNRNYHYDLGCFNSKKIVEFLNGIWPDLEQRIGIKFKAEVQDLIKRALSAGKIDVSKLSEKQKASIHF